jgi:hypothetical protein
LLQREMVIQSSEAHLLRPGRFLGATDLFFGACRHESRWEGPFPVVYVQPGGAKVTPQVLSQIEKISAAQQPFRIQSPFYRPHPIDLFRCKLNLQQIPLELAESVLG